MLHEERAMVKWGCKIGSPQFIYITCKKRDVPLLIGRVRLRWVRSAWM